MAIQTKDELLEQLSLAVEQIQKQYVEGSDVIKDSPETYFLCNSVDKILHHGLKEGLISWTTEPSIWPLLEKITCAKDIEEINMLRLKTDKEKCSAWIQMAVNVNLLGSYISTLQQDKSLLSNHYYDYAFLRDPVLSDTVKSLLNYGIANFDFQITVDRMPKYSNETRKQKAVIVNDSHEQTKLTELPNVEPDGLSKESLSKKKRKKKKPASINTVVITDLDNNDEPTNNISPETVNLTTFNGDNNYRDTKQNLEEIMDNYDSTDSNDKPLEHFDNSHVNFSNSMNSKAIVNESVSNNQNSDVDLTLDSEKPQDHEVTVEHRTMTEFPHRHTNDVEQQTEKRELSAEANEHKTKIFGSSEIEEYMFAQSLGKETRQSYQNPTLNREDIHKQVESDSCQTNSDSGISRTEFGASDFHLEEDCKYDESCGVSDVEEKLADVRNDVSTPENLDSRNLKEKHETIAPNTGNSTTLENSMKNVSPDEGSMSDRYSSALDDSGAHDSTNLTEISDERALNYRVRKVENPEFVSSSYSSTFSDVTDTSYDDRDLNFIPGIHTHKLSSSYKSGSSYDRKSTVDSLVSFDANGLPVFDTSHYTESSSRPSSIDDSSGRFADLASEWEMYEDLLNVEEEHFSGPDNFGGLSTSEELEIAIEHYKKMIKVKQDKSVRDELVQKLIKLRLRLQQEKDGPPAVNPKFRKILGHHFLKEDTSGRKHSCDQCGKVIWTIWQSLFTCKDCDYRSHRKCLEHIQRPCPNKNLSSVSYILDICPDTGLDAQQYRCAECRKAIAFSKVGVGEARSCDYTGQYFCDQCHWNDQVYIPARVLHNWDFTQYKVCRQTKQLLDLMKTRPLLNLQQINPMLFRYVEELREVGKLREDIMVMKKYFLTCREALESKLLIQLQKRQHFVDSSDIYSLQDLLDLNNDVLLPEISKIHALFLAHIKADCELCRARGFICEVCQDSSDVIFAFDPHVIKCTKCSAVYHKICFKPDECPKCHRKKKVVERT